jgi:hypothetical protein
MLKHFGITGLLVILLASPLRAEDMQSLREDAMFLMGAGLFVPGSALYCNERVQPNERLVAAAADWNKRHDAVLRKVVQVVEWSGGMSAEDRGKLDRMAMRMLQQSFDEQPDKVAYCNRILADLEAGAMDLETGEMAGPTQRIMAAALN